jgi:NADPH:quinone reductase-like Zn-dependent oxidoreductase
MRVLIQHRYGNEADLTVEEVAVPEPGPGPGEVRVRVEACGANASDWEFVTGRPAYARAVAGSGCASRRAAPMRATGNS